MIVFEQHSFCRFVAGVIPRNRMGIFEKVLFRALRGNLFMNHAEIQDPIIDPLTDDEVFKNVFIVFAHGKELINKIKKICESMGATLYPVDEHPEKRRENALEVMARLEDLRHVLDNTRAARKAELSRVADNLHPWQVILTKEKAMYHAMNKMSYDLNRKALIAEGWCPKASLGAIQYSLRAVTERTGSTIPPMLNEIPTTRTPPTSQKTNKVSEPFQGIVDAYGVAKYGEVNPGLYTIITFPFLFAVMFGDFGHGVIATIFASWVVMNEAKLGKKDWGEIWQMFFGGRYIILLMSVFSMFTGLVYNDAFSQAMTLMKSRYTFEFNNATSRWIGEKTLTYGFGLDPVPFSNVGMAWK
jgi:V-type H+-transporting ATPase subunit a